MEAYVVKRGVGIGVGLGVVVSPKFASGVENGAGSGRCRREWRGRDAIHCVRTGRDKRDHPGIAPRRRVSA